VNDPADRSAEFVDETLAEVPELAASLGRMTELLDPVTVPAGSLERLMRGVAEPPLRYAPFFERLCELWDLSEGAVRALLQRSRNEKAWKRAPLRGLELIKVDTGPRIAGAEAYLARFAPGLTFPTHSHQGHEALLILEGSYTDDRGVVFRSGDLHVMHGGTSHAFTIARGEPCVAAAVHHGIRFRALGLRLVVWLFGR
jgi:putative transcriptional regulator